MAVAKTGDDRTAPSRGPQRARALGWRLGRNEMEGDRSQIC